MFRIYRLSGCSAQGMKTYAWRIAHLWVLLCMIRGYKNKKTKAFAEGDFVKQLEPFRRQAEKRLRILGAAKNTNDLAQLPSNRFEALSGDRKGQYSIRINRQ